MPDHFIEYSLVQSKAKRVFDRIVDYLSPQSTELNICRRCIDLLADEGVNETWYYSVPALVLLGSRSCLSVSGRQYVPAEEVAGDNNLITIDLSPLIGEYWGDCARSFILENGVVTAEPKSEEFLQGLSTQQRLHRIFSVIAEPERTFEEVFKEINSAIDEMGYVNLDFMGNVGHSIVRNRDDRIYFEKGNGKKLKETDYFTFEPHICRKQGQWGFKHENIYYFDQSGQMRSL